MTTLVIDRQREHMLTKDTILLTPKQTAKFLKVSVRTLDRWRENALIPYYTTPKGYIRYNFADVVEILKLSSSKEI